jgi:hypothetical protein
MEDTAMGAGKGKCTFEWDGSKWVHVAKHCHNGGTCQEPRKPDPKKKEGYPVKGTKIIRVCK